jgi:polygalacturonase
MIEFTPSGSGPSRTTLQDKVRESLSVKDFGAVGDGVTDDTAAFTHALAYTDGKTPVLVPPGSYLLTKPLNVAYGVLWPHAAGEQVKDTSKGSSGN